MKKTLGLNWVHCKLHLKKHTCLNSLIGAATLFSALNLIDLSDSISKKVL